MPKLTETQFSSIQAKVADHKSKRLRILLSLKEVLNTVKKANGYSHNIVHVGFDVQAWDAVMSYDTPTIFIVDDSTQIKRHAGKLREYSWLVKLYGVCKELYFEQFEEFISDIEECIESNFNLAGSCTKAEVNQVLTDNQLFSEKENTHLFEMDIIVDYIRCHTNPR